jgi:hypothetical protein
MTRLPRRSQLIHPIDVYPARQLSFVASPGLISCCGHSRVELHDSADEFSCDDLNWALIGPLRVKLCRPLIVRASPLVPTLPPRQAHPQAAAWRQQRTCAEIGVYRRPCFMSVGEGSAEWLPCLGPMFAAGCVGGRPDSARGRLEDEPAAQRRNACRSQSRRSQGAAPPSAQPFESGVMTPNASPTATAQEGSRLRSCIHSYPIFHDLGE